MLLAELLEAVGVKGVRLRSRAWARPRRAPSTARSCSALPARPRAAAVAARSAAGSTSTRCARSTPSDRGTREVMRDAPKLLDRLAPEDAEHFARCGSCSTTPGIHYELDPTLVRGLDYYTRTLFEFSSDALGAQSGVGGGGRYDRPDRAARRPADARPRAGRPASSGCCWPRASSRSSADRGGPVHRAARPRRRHGAAFGLAREARRAGLRAQLELAGRSLQGPAQARGPDRRQICGDHRRRQGRR